MTAALSPDIELAPAEMTRAVVSAAFASIDETAAAKVTRESHWKNNFSQHLTALDTQIAADPSRYRTVAAAGLRAAHELFTTEGAAARADVLRTTTLTGSKPPMGELTIPYRGRQLGAQELLDEVHAWTARGLCTASVPASIERVLMHPEWLPLEGHTIVVLGAMAKIGPYWPLLRWGARVAAVDLPHAKIATALQFRALEAAGTALLPVGPDNSVPGADILSDPVAVADWIERLPGRLVLVDTLRGAPESQFFTAMAADSLIQRVVRARPDTVLADLPSPADSFAVHPEDVSHSRDAFTGSSGRLRGLARTFTHGNALQPNYPRGDTTCLADAHLPQHSWDFTMAKRIARWRAVDAAAHGTRVSHNVAPATFSAPMRSHALSQMVIRSAARFGIEPFEEQTATMLMAALLVHDLCAGIEPPSSPTEAEYDGAVHGGLWTSPYKPRSVIGLVGGSQPTTDTLDIGGN